MMCHIFNLAVLLLALAGILLMVGWKSGASQLARIAIALVIGSAILAWLVDVLGVLFARPGVQMVAGGMVLLFFVALTLLGVGWFLKRRSEAKEKVRPTIRRRVGLMDAEEQPAAASLPASSATDDLNLFGGNP